MVELYEYAGEQEEWDRFVTSHPEGRFYQLIGYKKALEDAYGYRSKYLLFLNGNEIAAVLPAFILNDQIGRRRLISLPFAEYGGPIGGNLTESDIQEIKSHIQTWLRDEKFIYLEMHAGLGVPVQEMQSMFVQKPMYNYAILRLCSADEMWKKVVDYQVRKAVNKAERSGLRAYQETSQDAIIHKFYPLYLLSMKRLGTPPHPQRLFTGYLRNLSDNLRIFFVDTSEGQTITGLMGFALNNRVHIIHTASNADYWNIRPNDLVHWEFIKWACENGYELFDFSVVRYEGQARYKKKWGVQLYDYSYYYLFPETNTERDIKPIGPSLWTVRAFAWFWQRCIPVKSTEYIGPSIRKRLGR